MTHWSDTSRGRWSGRRATWVAVIASALAIPAPSRPATASDGGVEQDHRRWIGTWATAPQPFLPGTLTPDKELVRRAVNDWIRGGAEFDAVVDFDAVLRDPSRPTRLLPAYDSGDHLHANDAGHAATGRAIPLALFEGR
jgi:hypothetical protein